MNIQNSAYAADEILALGGWLIDGLSASKIALKLTDMRLGRSVTRNAIIGIVQRNKTLKAIGFSKSNGRGINAKYDGRKGGRKTAKAQRFPVKQSRFPGVLAAPKPKIPSLDAINIAVRLEGRIAPKPLPAFPPVLIICREITILELASGDCRWAVNDPPRPGNDPHLFCGLPVEDGRSWCPHHYLRSVSFGTSSERQASRDLAKAAA